MLAQVTGGRAEFLSKNGDKAPGSPPRCDPGEMPVWTGFSRGLLLTCYNQRFPMADIRPFRALRYNSERVAASEAVTQPYDKITSGMQDRYYAASPYNLVRIILGRREPGDNTVENVYTRAAAFGRRWREEGILEQDRAPSLYSYSQTFTAPSGMACERRGLIALGRVEDYAAKVVYRHEQTLAKPKADRLELLRATRVHYEQLFLLYEDSGEIDRALRTSEKATIEVSDDFGVAHRVWQISDAAVIGLVREKMKDKKLVIADGHHRYETALNFRNECRNGAQGANPQAPYEYVMMTFVNVNDPGLLVLPTHRVVHSLSSFSAEDFLESARDLFEVQEVEGKVDAARATELLHE